MLFGRRLLACCACGALLLCAVAGSAPGLGAGGPGQLRAWLRQRGLAGQTHLLRALGPALLNASSRADDPAFDACQKDVAKVLLGEDLGSLQMLDASVKVPEGLLAYSLTHIGHWEECVSARTTGAAGPVRGQLCLVGLGLKAPSPSAWERRARAAAAQAEGVGPLAGASTLRLGACVPSTCSHRHVQALFARALLGDEQAQAQSPLGVSVEPSDCTTERRPPLDAADWTAVGLLGVLGALLLLGSLYDWLAPAPRLGVLTAFSVLSNGRKLLAPPPAHADSTLSAVHGIRFLSMCWVVLGHRYYHAMTLPNINPAFFATFMQDVWRVGITNATVSVDTFFLLSGLLVGYLFFKQEPSKRRIPFPMYFVHRYIRLTPAFALVVLLNATLVYRMGWGPLWPSVMEMNRDNCRTAWWQLMIYVNNYVDPEYSCVGQTWYLMVDMQLYWLSPLLLLPLKRWPRATLCGICALVVANVVGVFTESYVLELPSSSFAGRDLDQTMQYFKYYYIPAYTRFAPYVLGLALGWALGAGRAAGRAGLRLGRAGAALSWAAVAALMLVPLFAGAAFYQPSPPGRVATALFNALHRLAWSLGVAAAAALCASGAGGPVNAFLSWTGFQVLGRLSYCVFLVHFSLQSMQSASVRTNTYLSDGTILPAFAGDLLMSFVLAAALSLAAEGPFMALEKELLGGRRRPPSQLKPSAPPADAAPADKKELV